MEKAFTYMSDLAGSYEDSKDVILDLCAFEVRGCDLRSLCFCSKHPWTGSYAQ